MHVDQNFDNYSVEYTYPDGTSFSTTAATSPAARAGSPAMPTAQKARLSSLPQRHTPGKVRTYKGHKMEKGDLIWAFPQPEQSPYQLEWDDLIDAIRQNKPYNEAERGAEASLVSSMGRMAAHTGQIVTYDQAMNCEHEFAPDVDKLTMDSPAPVQAGPDSKYPVPQPGILKQREY